MAEKQVPLTREGLQKLEAELDYLIRVRRREVAERIKEALGFGDISENSNMTMRRTSTPAGGPHRKIRSILRNAVIDDDDDDGDTTQVRVGPRWW